jgi:nucleoside-diphosphate-sugar epimerase
MMARGLPLIIVQPGAVYGPGDASPQGQLFRQYLSRKLPMVPRGTAFCWGHVDDTARAHVLAMERGVSGQSYIIAGQPATLLDVLRLAQRITGVPVPRLRPSPALIAAVANLASFVERMVPLDGTVSSEYLRVAAGVTYLGSNAKAKRELGFDVRPLAEGLRETLAYERQGLQS